MATKRFLALCCCFALAGASKTTVTLNDGVQMPSLAFGAQLWDTPTCKSATTAALQAGFRFIWSSTLIGDDCQKAQAEAINASSIPRASLFIAGTVNTQQCSDVDSCYTTTKSGAMNQFAVLGQSVLDMIMLDYPSSASGCDGVKGQWKALSEVYDAKKVHTIAVSNFSPEQLACLNSSHVRPTVNQMQYSVGHGTDTVVADDAKYGVVVQAYSPLGSGGLVGDPLLIKIGQAHKKSAAQVALRWIIQHNATITTQATELDYLKEDVAIYDFELSADEMKQLDAHQASATTQVHNVKWVQ